MADFKERLYVESLELGDKITGLDKFLYSEVYYKLPDEQQNLLCNQVYTMRDYHRILKERIALIEGWKESYKNCGTVSN